MIAENTEPAELQVHCSLFTTPHEDPLGTRLRLIAQAGFDGVQTNPVAEADWAPYAELLAETGLRLSACAVVQEDDEPEELFERAAATGAISLNAQLNGYWRDQAWQDQRIARFLELSAQYRIPFFLETHRHRITQDIRHTLALVARHPTLALCGDFSHYTVSAELAAPWPGEWRAALRTLAARCGEVHLRVNQGERVQDPVPLVSPAQHEEFLQLWTTARDSWPGDRFLATAELLPDSIGYATTGLDGRPISDIWHESLLLLDAVRVRLAHR